MHPRIGWFPESTFYLADNSRLPKWFKVPAGYDEKRLTVRIDYYSPSKAFFFLGNENVKASLIDQLSDGNILDSKLGIKEYYPDPEVGSITYPIQFEIHIDGTTELVEHKKMEPVFYLAN